jgi:hypothetical protein
MCLIIDTCTVPSVFNVGSRHHKTFTPVLNWVTCGNGCMIYGGTKYKGELSRLHRFFRLIIELSKQRRAIELPSAPIDAYAAELKIMVSDMDFDDEHLVALVATSNCRVVCTDDKRAHSYLKRADLYPKNIKPPKIYNSASHSKLCCDENVIKICRRSKKQPPS